MAEVGIGSGKRRPVQVRRTRIDGWTVKRRQRFIDMLAGTCNVRMAADAAGVQTGSAYRLRRTDPAFDAAWREALVLGYERLETALLERALRSVDRPPPGEDDDTARSAERAVEAMDPRVMAMVLNHHRAAAEGRGAGARPGARRVATAQETNDALLKKLAVLEKQVRERS
jgi:hypothetical protein